MQRCFLILIFFWLQLPLFADFAEKILQRNGDVYVLVTRKDKVTSPEVGVYKFTRKTGYGKPSKLAPGNASMQSNMQYYSGLAVDKFGHVKLFRNRGDENPVNLLTETKIHPASPDAWPGWESISFYDEGGKGAPNKTKDASPPGWVYVVEPNGKYGWYKLYDWDRVGLPGSSGGAEGYSYKPADLSVFPEGTEIIPKVTDGYFLDHIRGYHGGFWNDTCKRGTYAFEPDSEGLFHPPINCFWMNNTNKDQSGKRERAGRRIYKVEKAVSALYLDTYVSKGDNEALKAAKDGAAAGSQFTDLKNNVDFFNSGVGEYYDQAQSALNTSLAFSQSYLKYNNCGDMCGQDGTPAEAPPLVVNKARAKFSSGGANQLNQRSYMVKTRSAENGSKLVTWVVGLKYDPATSEYKQQNIIQWDNGQVNLGPTEVANDGVLSTNQGGGIGDRRILIYDLGSYPDIIRTVQTSRRVKASAGSAAGAGDDSKDFVYVTNAPPSHFNVSSSFWGTGGVVWWAEEQNNDLLKLHYEQYNHFTGSRIRASDGDPVQAENVESLFAIGADGDNFVYILHGGKGTANKGGVDGPDTMTALVAPNTLDSLQELKDKGRLISDVPSLPLDAGLCDSAAGPCRLAVEVKIYAGPIVEKIAPLPGSKPVRIGVIPLEDTGQSCTAIARFENPTSSVFALEVVGGQVWDCSAADASEALENYNFEMAVINVANPPATGGNQKLDIVDPLGGAKNYLEDTEYHFQMENPPIFDGAVAQLGLVPDAELNVYGNVHMSSNYDITGIERLKSMMGCAGGGVITEPPGNGGALSGCRKWFDNDGRIGRLKPSFVDAPLEASQSLLHPKIGGSSPGGAVEVAATVGGISPTPSQDSARTLRWRWRVIARTPPLTNKDFQTPVCERLMASPPSPRTWPHSPAPGVMYDSCWQDLKEDGPNGTRIPGDLVFTPEDPGNYEIQLMFGGLRFDADGLTFLDKPTSVTPQVVVTSYSKLIHVGAKAAQGGEEIRDILVSSQDLNSSLQARAGMPMTDAVFLSDFTQTDSLVGSDGRLPVYPTAYYSSGDGPSSQPLILSWDAQDTPIVAEADISFFRLQELQYLNQETQFAGTTQEKFAGVGAWDYRYPQNHSVGQLKGANLSLVDKQPTHPSNWDPTQANFVEEDVSDSIVEGRRGYDASGDPETSVGKNESGALLAPGSFENAHQGTLASCQFYPPHGSFDSSSQNCLIDHPMSLYTWWEIKYAWFLRYRAPDGSFQKRIVKQGNLAEIFALNSLAADNSNWRHVVANLAPNHLRSSLADGSSQSKWPSDSPLMRPMQSCADATNCRDIRVRIPLMDPGSGLLSTPNDPDSALNNVDGLGSNFQQIYEVVKPIQFNLPSDPGVYELSLQLFYPVMKWEGRDQKMSPSGASLFAYFDAVYWGDASEAAGTPVFADQTKIPFEFGSDEISAWPRFGTPRGMDGLTALDGDASAMGLELADSAGGFEPLNPGDNVLQYAAPGGGRDHFADVLVLDLTPPEMNVLAGDSLSADAGGIPDEDIVLEVVDNHRFSRFAGVSDVGGDELLAPALVQFSREMGYDPRNRYGMGLKTVGLSPEPAFGFNLSYTGLEAQRGEVSGLAHPQYSLTPSSDLPLGMQTPYSVAQPGFTYSPSDIQTDFSTFHFPALPSEDFGTPAVFGDAYTFADLRWQNPMRVFPRRADTSGGVARVNSNQAYYYHPPHRFGHADRFEAVRTPTAVGSSNRVQVPMNLMTLFPSLPESPWHMDPRYDGNASDWIESIEPMPSGPAFSDYQATNPDCLVGVSPIEVAHNADECRVVSRFRIPHEALVAPYFLDGPNPLTLNTYAKGRDVRVAPVLPLLTPTAKPPVDAAQLSSNSHGSWLSFDFNTNFERRQGAETHGVLGEKYERSQEYDPSTILVQPSGGRGDRVRRNLTAQAQSTLAHVGTMQVDDDVAPNFRVIFTETKNRTQTEFTVMASQAYDPSIVQQPERVFFFRTQDPRDDMGIAENNVFEMEALSLLDLDDSVRDNLNLWELEPSGDLGQQEYRIPEDVRFEVRVFAADNRNLEDISIRISGGHAAMFSHPDGLEGVDSQYEFPATESSSGRVYQQMKLANRFHFYPNAGVYDVLQIEVYDQPGLSGNGNTLRIPIRVINQSVAFRKIGSEQRLR